MSTNDDWQMLPSMGRIELARLALDITEELLPGRDEQEHPELADLDDTTLGLVFALAQLSTILARYAGAKLGEPAERVLGVIRAHQEMGSDLRALDEGERP